MSARKTSTVRLLVVGLGLSLIFIAAAAAQQAGQARQNLKDEVGQKLVTFEMRDKPWPQVLEWLADSSGLPVFADLKPTGTFTYISPKNAAGVAEKKTISEVVDDLNAALRTKKFLIVRLNNAFTIVPADEQVPTSEIQRLGSVDELYKHANSELVAMYYPLKMLNADEFAVQVKKMMGQFGQVYPISTTNTLYMQDEVASLKQIVAMIKECENIDNRSADTLSYKCEYIPARDAEKVLKAFLGDPAKNSDGAINPMMMMAGMQGPGGMPMNMPMMAGGGDGNDPRNFRRGGPGRGPRGAGGPAGAADSPGIKAVVQAITCNEQTNTVFVRGPADKLAQARKVLKDIDVGTEKFITGPPIMRTYTIPSGNAEAVAAMLTQNYKNSEVIKITALGNSQILVYAPPQDHFQIAKDLETSKPGGGAVKIQLNNTDANRIVDTLGKIYSSTDGKVGYPYFEADVSENAIIVRGSSEQIAEVRDIIKVLTDQPALGIGATGASSLRVITLEKGNAAALADALQKAMSQLRENPVKVVTPDISKPTTTPKEDKQIKKDGGEEQDDPKGQQNQLFDPQKKNEPKPGDKKAPITITAVGNRLIISSDDPAAIALAQELIRIYTQAPKGDTGFEIIRLKNAKAADAAKILDDAFNGPKQTNLPGMGVPGFGGGFGGGRGGGGGNFLQALMAQQQSAQSTVKPRIRVVADPATNSLLVQASPLDMLEIRHLLDKAIDSDDTDSNAVIKTWPPITLKYADATEVASTLQSVYREHMNAGATSGFQSFGPGGITVGGRSRGGSVDANGNLRTISLSFGVDTRSNSLILQCSELMYKDVKKLIDQLDASAKDSNKTIKLVQVTGVDPLLVQQALDLIQGRRSTNTASNMMGQGQQMGGGGFAGQPGGGFQGGQRGGMMGQPGGGGFNGGGGFGGGGFNGGGGGFNGGGGGFGLLGGGGRGGFGGGGFGGGGAGAGFGGGGGRGGAGGGGRGGQQRSPGGAPDGGPDFFEHAVMDDPRSLSLYDPRLDNSPTTDDMIRALAVGRAPETLTAELLAIAAGETQQPTQPAVPSTTSQDVPAPRRPVTADILPELGYIIITADNPKDVEAIEQIIKIIISTSKGAEIRYEIIPLKFADATSVTTTLNQMFSRVSVNATNSARILPGTTQNNISLPGGNISASQNVPAQNLVLLPLIRFNAIFVAAPEARLQDVKKRIGDLDRPTADISRAVPFGLKNASAKNVATIINNFYAARGESQNVNQIRITEDDTTNTILVQAAPADMEDIRRLIEHLDSTPTAAVNDLRIYRLRIALADELSNLLVSALAQGVVTTGTTGTTTGAGILGAGVGGGGIGGGAAGLGGFAGGAGGGFAGAARPAATGGIGGTTAITGQGGTATSRNTGLRFVFGPNNFVDGLFLQDIHITPDLRTNSIIISAPKQTMPMLFKLLEELDVAPSARAEIKVFPLKKADAVTLETILQNLFFGTNTTVPGSGTIANGNAGAVGAGGAAAAAVAPPAAAGTGAGLTGSGALGQTGPVPRSILQVPGQPAEGAPLVELHITADPRTNSLIVAGGRNELLVIEAIILKLEDTPIIERQDQVVHLQNASAADVATVLQNYIIQTIRPYVTTSQNNALQELERDIIVIAEPFTNKLLISATAPYFAKLMKLVQELDAKPPQVMIQVMICEVDLSSTEEFGVEIGLQSPVLFQRSIYPNTASGFGQNTAISFSQPGYSSATPGAFTSSGFIPSAIATGSLNPFAQPGFNFNASPGLPALGNNPLGSPGVVGSQGVSNLGVGRADANGLSGFVFSAASDSFNLLVRALKTQGRVDILSRPQVMTLDNQTATINIGQQIPYLSSSTLTATGASQQSIDRVIVGVNLTVTPRISPDGTVLMRVTPSVSSVAPNQENLGNGVLSPIFNVQQVDTTVQAMDGETVAIGGLITKSENKTENKIPVLGDLPFLGALFRYRTQSRAKTELLVIMTPHVVRSKEDADRILGEEGRRMDWIMGDVLRTHGTYGMEPIIPRKDAAGGPGAGNANCPAPTGDLEGPPPVALPPLVEPLTQPRIVPQAAPENAPPQARPMVQPQASMPMQSLQPVSGSYYPNSGTQAGYPQGGMDRGMPDPVATSGTMSQQPAQTATEPATKQPSRWNLFNRGQ